MLNSLINTYAERNQVMGCLSTYIFGLFESDMVNTVVHTVLVLFSWC